MGFAGFLSEYVAIVDIKSHTAEDLVPRAEGGEVKAQLELADRNATGRGVEQNYEEALKWFQAAAESGSAGAEHRLGLMYAKGEGVEQDAEAAAGWYILAAAQDEVNGSSNNQRLGANLNAAEMERAETLAAKWCQKYGG